MTGATERIMTSSLELEGRVALVTGAARNIGRATALALADAGARIAVNTLASRAEAQATVDAIRQAGGEAELFLADVTNEDSVAAMVDAVRARFGGIDILVNNAAVRREVPFLSMSLQEWKQITGIILDGAFNCSRACIPHMAGGFGRIVNLGGITAHTGAVGRAHVVAAKAGIEGLTRALAREFIGQGMTVNCVVPGHTNTSRAAGFVPPLASHDAGGAHSGEPADIAAAIRFLCSPAAGHITGQSLHVNGGFLMP